MRFVTLDVFTDTPFRGNPLAIVIVEHSERAALEQADGPDTKQLIAKEFNLSETVFLFLRPGETLSAPDRSSAEREIGIFTIDRELPFAGHPTIGTAYFILHHLGWDFVTTLLPPAGPIAITPSSGGHVTARIPHDVHLHSRTLRSLYELGDAAVTAQIKPALHKDEIIRNAELDAPVFSIVKGMTFLLVALPSLEHLASVTPTNRLDLNNYVSLLDAGSWGHGFNARYYYVPQGTPTTDSEDATRTEAVRARMVELGFEDPATGSAASCLAAYRTLYQTEVAHKARYLVTQGVEMGRQSEIVVDIAVGTTDGGARVLQELRLGGSAKFVMSGDLYP
ncbi:hypothetical protein BD289DRAFT_463112 [Coniella lustricola]|uniref:Phenazine biosynthesis-like protein n=1 Tax=Coniella lustricola TaxID=2025994 RepID=A0A2T2ZXF7_9PEZI|nr:hypothetical protein BD289DRAFT_463112 [Coniella lustricola]